MFPQHYQVRVRALWPLIGLTCISLVGQPVAGGGVIDLPVTNGLVRWWPNLFDARDEITGQEGFVMGVLPPVPTGAEDSTEFGRATAWVQLQPAITNDVFTLSFWLLCRTNRPVSWSRLLGQESGEGEWLFQTDGGEFEFFVGGHDWDEANWVERVRMTPETWQHVVLARRPDGTNLIWVDGVLRLIWRRPHVWPRASRWLTVGNTFRGGEGEFQGGVCDLLAYDRVLTDREVQALHEAGLPKRAVRNTAARRTATARPFTSVVSTNVVVPPPQSWNHRRFTTEDGLPGNIIKAVLQAQNGYLWVGTEEGLARFDGRQFRSFTADNTPALRAIGQTVWSLAEAPDGTIWAGIFGGLLRIQNLEFTAFTNGLPQRFVLQAQPAGDGSLWVAGFNAFVPRGPCWLRRYHPESGTCSAEVVVPGHPRRLIVATNGLWLATEQPQQMHFWDGHAPATTLVGTVDDARPIVRLAAGSAPTPDPQVRVWKDDFRGTHWWVEINLAPGGPLFHWLWDTRVQRVKTGRWNGPPAAEAWLGVFDDLSRIHGGLLERIEPPDRTGGAEIACLCANREGGVWFGTEEDGLHFLQQRLIRVFTAEDGLPANDVRSVSATPQGDVWVATADGLGHSRNGPWENHGTGKLRALACDQQGEPWFGLQEFGPVALRRGGLGPAGTAVNLGLTWQDPNSVRFARDGTLWVACERGLTWIKPERLKLAGGTDWVPDPASAEPAWGRYAVGKELPHMFPLGLVEDEDGSMWMGSRADGLFHIAGGRVEGFNRLDGLPGNDCVPVYRDETGALWVVAENSLVRRSGEVFQSVSEAGGLPKDVFLDLIEDDQGSFWISGKRGIHRVARGDLEALFAGRINRAQSLTLGARDGLLTPECSSRHYPTMAKTPDGKIWVATRNGLAVFDPRQVRLDTQPLVAVIEQLVVNRKELPLPHLLQNPSPPASTRQTPLRLPPGSGERLEFHYTAVSLVAADRVRFQHRLDGYDTEWSPETDLRLAFFTNLRPAPYRFRVRASNAHGVPNDQETTLSFVILPFFWQTGAFRISGTVALLGLAALLHGRRLHRLRWQEAVRHEQALAAEKARIAADMHDELGAVLTQITILGEVAKSQAPKNTPTRPILDRISEAAREVTARMSDLVWATNPRNDTLDNLVACLREHAASQLETAFTQPCLRFPAAVPDAKVSATFRRNVLLVLKEALHNSVKHSHARSVTVELEVGHHTLCLRIKDDGIGFKASQSHPRGHGNGLGNMERRIRDLGGQFSLHTAPGAGVQIDCRVPLP